MLICQLTDLHVCAVGVSCNRVSETNMFAARAFRTVAAMKPMPDVVVITGDLTDNGMPAEYANLAGLIRQHLPMPVYVIPGNHDRRDNFRRDLGFLPGVTADPEYLQYAVDEHPRRPPGGPGHAGHRGFWCGPRRTARRATELVQSDIGRGARQADIDRHAPSAVLLRHSPDGPDQFARHRGLRGCDRASSSGEADHLRPPSPDDLRPGGACD